MQSNKRQYGIDIHDFHENCRLHSNIDSIWHKRYIHAACLLEFGLLLNSTVALAEEWLPPPEPETEPARAPFRTHHADEAREETLPFSTQPVLRVWSDAYHEHGEKTRSSILGLSINGFRQFGMEWMVTSGVDVDYSSTHPNASDDAGWRLGFREFHIRHNAGTWWMEAGRINVRNGVATGYNPSDFYRMGAISATRTRDPQRLRESRLGAVQLRAGTRMIGSEWTVSLSPSLHDRESPAWYDPRWGAVNGGASQHGLEISLPRWNGVFSQLLWQHRSDIGDSIGANVNAPFGQATIIYAEWARTHRKALGALAQNSDVHTSTVQQWSTGLRFTSDLRITLGLEWQYNGAGLSRDEWSDMWQFASTTGAARALADAGRSCDPLARNSMMISLLWERFGHRDAELNCFLRRNQTDHSRLGWCEWRYKGTDDEWSLSISRADGQARSEFAAIAQRWSMAMRWRHYW